MLALLLQTVYRLSDLEMASSADSGVSLLLDGGRLISRHGAAAAGFVESRLFGAGHRIFKAGHPASEAIGSSMKGMPRLAAGY